MSDTGTRPDIRTRLLAGGVIPAHPLALTSARRLDEQRQRALTRYYMAAGAHGIAVGVHTTQFAIRTKGLLEPVLALAAETAAEGPAGLIRIAGVTGATAQATAEARLAADTGYEAVLVSLGGLPEANDRELVRHLGTVAEILPVMGFYLQLAVGGRPLGYAFWRRLCETVAGLVAIKVAPFDRYATNAVVRAVADAGRAGEVALYTGNDDHILLDLLSPVATSAGTLRMAGGLLGHWACWTRTALDHWRRCRAAADAGTAPADLLTLAGDVTDANAAIFDAAHDFRGVLPGIHEILRRQGLLAGACCLDEREALSPGQLEEIDRVVAAYPHLSDDAFVAEHLHEWLA